MGTKTIEERVAFLERLNARILAALGRHFVLTLEPDSAAIPLPWSEAGGFNPDAMTKAKLIDHAEANGIDLGDATTKAEIVAILQAQPAA